MFDTLLSPQKARLVTALCRLVHSYVRTCVRAMLEMLISPSTSRGLRQPSQPYLDMIMTSGTREEHG